MKPETPLLFFLNRVLPVLAVPFESSEYLLGDPKLVSDLVGVMASGGRSPAEKLAECLRDGVNIRGSGEVCDRGGGTGRRREACKPGVVVVSTVLLLLLDKS